MRVIENLLKIAENDESIFRRQLAKEDLARFQKLDELNPIHAEFAAYLKEGLYIGWTQNDIRTHELKTPLTALISAFHTIAMGNDSEKHQQHLEQAWAEFHKERLEKLVHCL